MFTAVLFIIAKIWTKSKCPSTAEWIKPWWLETQQKNAPPKRISEYLTGHQKPHAGKHIALGAVCVRFSNRKVTDGGNNQNTYGLLGRNWRKGATDESSRRKERFCTVVRVSVTRVCTFVNTHPSVQWRSVHFTMWKFTSKNEKELQAKTETSLVV